MKQHPKEAQLKGHLPGQLQINCTPPTIKSTRAKDRVGGRVYFSLAGERQHFSNHLSCLQAQLINCTPSLHAHPSALFRLGANLLQVSIKKPLPC